MLNGPCKNNCGLKWLCTKEVKKQHKYKLETWGRAQRKAVRCRKSYWGDKIRLVTTSCVPDAVDAAARLMSISSDFLLILSFGTSSKTLELKPMLLCSIIKCLIGVPVTLKGLTWNNLKMPFCDKICHRWFN